MRNKSQARLFTAGRGHGVDRILLSTSRSVFHGVLGPGRKAAVLGLRRPRLRTVNDMVAQAIGIFCGEDSGSWYATNRINAKGASRSRWIGSGSLLTSSKWGRHSPPQREVEVEI